MAKYTTIKAVSTADEGGGGGGPGGRRVARRTKLTEQVVIGTHGRCKNWVSDRVLDLDGVNILVFDEADEMLKAEAFADESVRLIKTARKRNPGLQLLLFSATFNEKIKNFAIRIAPKANQVFVPKESLSLDVIKQYNVTCPLPMDKTKVLQEQIFPNCEKLGQTIIFTRTRAEAARLHQMMAGLGYKCTSLRGDMEAGDRDAVVNEFREGVTKILIATDVLSRGFDVSQVTLVVNYDIPVERDGRTPAFDTYLHRIGRSGRFGRKGAAFNLICGEQDGLLMREVGEYFNKPIPEVAHDDEDGFIEVLNQAGLTDQTT
ncbi:MAG: P-loop containing nucleoside triphosphate hydrolase protein [Monoraphidium minutum]|nr:MAG: P-loop containing nucleoside triphosphate hydrolase protein [Monoraphidium minutum]